MSTFFATAFFLGLAGSAHCVGMCGPIALAVPSPNNTWSARTISTLILNSGRVVTYMLIGAMFGVFGVGVRLAGLQQGVSILAGVVLLMTLMIPGISRRIPMNSHVAMLIARGRSLLGRNLLRTSPEALFLTGTLNGMLPCGLVYAAAIGASTMGSIKEAVLFMGVFGVGTWPALIALRMGGGMLGERSRTVLRKASPVIVSTLAVLLILRGMELNIPFISPPPTTGPSALINCH